MILVDRTAAVVPDQFDTPTEGAVIVTHQVLVTLLVHVFERIWEDGRLLIGAEPEKTEEWTPTPLEREVIRLLAEGNKDESVARRVGMSLRSVRRLIAHLSHELGAESRFALGVACSERGWAHDSSAAPGA